MLTSPVILYVSLLDLFGASSRPCGPRLCLAIAFIGHIFCPLSCICHQFRIFVFVQVFFVDTQVEFSSTTDLTKSVIWFVVETCTLVYVLPIFEDNTVVGTGRVGLEK